MHWFLGGGHIGWFDQSKNRGIDFAPAFRSTLTPPPHSRCHPCPVRWLRLSSACFSLHCCAHWQRDVADTTDLDCAAAAAASSASTSTRA